MMDGRKFAGRRQGGHRGVYDRPEVTVLAFL